MAGGPGSGRKKAPIALRALSGRHEGVDSGGRKLEEPLPFERQAPEPPSWLGPYALEEWNYVVPRLARLDLLKTLDQMGLATYCQMVESFRQATEAIEKYGAFQVLPTGEVKQNPAVVAQRNAAASIRQWCGEYGLTPRAETSLPNEQKDKEQEANPFAS